MSRFSSLKWGGRGRTGSHLETCLPACKNSDQCTLHIGLNSYWGGGGLKIQAVWGGVGWGAAAVQQLGSLGSADALRN